MDRSHNGWRTDKRMGSQVVRKTDEWTVDSGQTAGVAMKLVNGWRTDKRMGARVPSKPDELGTTVEVTLEPGESVRYEGSVFLRVRRPWFAALGRLFLTTKRLIWVRYRWTLPREADVYLPLAGIEGWEIKPTPWWWRWRWLKVIRRSLEIRTASKTLEFLPRYASEDADEWAEALDEVMTEAGLASQGART